MNRLARFWRRSIAVAAPRFAFRMSPEDWALSLALGFVLGVFPAPALPTVLCGVAALALRLNPSALQAVNYLVSPLQLALFTPLARLGDRVLCQAPSLSAAGHVTGFPAIAWRAACGVLTASAHAMAAWLCVCVPVGLLLYALLASAFRHAMPRGAN